VISWCRGVNWGSCRLFADYGWECCAHVVWQPDQRKYELVKEYATGAGTRRRSALGGRVAAIFIRLGSGRQLPGFQGLDTRRVPSRSPDHGHVAASETNENGGNPSTKC